MLSTSSLFGKGSVCRIQSASRARSIMGRSIEAEVKFNRGVGDGSAHGAI
jgi:hypothetical protein